MNTKTILKNCPNQLWGTSRLSPKEYFKLLYETTDVHCDFDFYGAGNSIESFEKKFANILGKEDAIFLPSGTMAQQISLRVWADNLKKNHVAYHHLSHLEIHEEKAIYKLHPQIKISLLGNKNQLITLDELKNSNIQNSILLLELPQRELGGILPSWEELVEIKNWCDKNDVTMHLDGARLWESTPFYQKTPSQICELFDSVYVSFYKGIGSVAGAILAGNSSFIKDCKMWQRRYGGNIISLYPYYLAADIAYENRIGKMPLYFEKAKELSVELNKFAKLKTYPLVAQTNMFHLEISENADVINKKIIQIVQSENIKVTPLAKEVSKKKSNLEFSVGDNTLNYKTSEILKLFAKVFN